MRCLVVDDNPEHSELVGRLLSAHGHRVTCVEGGQAAVAVIYGNTFDIVVLDLGMPDMPGAQVIREIREAEPSLRILVVSGFDDQKHILEALRAGADGFLLKTDVSERLTAAVQDIRAGSPHLSPRVARVVLDSLRNPA